MDKKFVNTHKAIWFYGCLSVIAYGYLALHSQQYAQATLTEMWIVCGACGVFSILCWHECFKLERQNILLPARLISLFIGFAIVFRVIGIISFPILEDDFYRYLWDGKMTIETGSPYGIIPSDFFASTDLDSTFSHILGLINHPDIPTVYGPVNQYIFAFTSLFFPAQVWPLQLIFALVDLGIILLLLKLTKPSFVLLYAWSPLMIKEFSFTAHPDVVGAFFLIAAFYAYTFRAWYWAAILLAFSAGVKVFALVAAPLLLKLNWRAWIVFFITAMVLSLPFGVKAAWFPEGLSAMAGHWLFNAPMYILLDPFFRFQVIKISLLALFVFVAISYFFFVSYRFYFEGKLLPIRADYLYGMFFLCIPVLNPWYFVWLLPFAAIYPSRWAWVASISLLLSYASGINLPQSEYALYQQPNWLLIIEFGCVFVALFFDIKQRNQPIK